MSEQSIPAPLPPRSALWSTLVTVFVHAILLLVLEHWVRALVPMCSANFANWQMKLPALTELVLDIGDFVVQNPMLIRIGIICFLILDLVVLYSLSGPRSFRVLREIWSGLIVITILALTFVASIALTTPGHVILEKLTKNQGR